MAAGVKVRREQSDDIGRLANLVTEWEAKRAAAEEALRSAESTSGEEVLEDPSLVSKAAAAMREARDEIELAGRAAEAARTKLNAAKVEALEAEAKKLDTAAAALEKKLASHDARSAELLAALEAHEGKFVPEVELMAAKRSAGLLHEGTAWSLPRSEVLRREVERERLRASVVRDVAAGVDPEIRLRALADIVDGSVLGVQPDELYPPCVLGPSAVIRAPRCSSKIASVVRRLADHDAEQSQDDGPEIAQRQAVIDRINAKLEQWEKTRLVDYRPAPGEIRGRDTRVQWIEDRKQWRAGAPKRREALLDELEALTGSRDPETALS